MRFFIQGRRELALTRLTGFDYFTAKPKSGEAAQDAALFRREADFAFFAARLGWDYEQYAQHTPVQLAFVRKELETVTVGQSNLFKDAVQVAVANCLSKKRHKLWKKRNGSFREDSFTYEEIDALKEQHRKNPPWTPWGGGKLNG